MPHKHIHLSRHEKAEDTLQLKCDTCGHFHDIPKASEETSDSLSQRFRAWAQEHWKCGVNG